MLPKWNECSYLPLVRVGDAQLSEIRLEALNPCLIPGKICHLAYILQVLLANHYMILLQVKCRDLLDQR